MSTIDLQQAASLPDIINGLVPGEQLTIVRDGVPVATITRNGSGPWPSRAGSAKHLPHWMAPDFDAPLDDFRPYME
jgi:hypothetical protein